MAIHTTRGLQATRTFLQNTGTGTRTGRLGPRDISTDNRGWREYDCGDDERERTAREEYVEEQWGDAEAEHG
jgi:hypothetical protein